MDNKRRYIEDAFPVKEVSFHSAKEKNIRHGHISTLHIWWARRPLASSRATAYAALIPPAKDAQEWDEKQQFITELSKWENSLNQTILDKARKDILKASGGKPPKVLDPFAGGGAIPLEALRLGCETYASDINPVAVLILKCTLEYPQKYGKPGEVMKEVEDFGKKRMVKTKVQNKLLEDVKRWGQWVLEEAKKEIGQFYPEDEDGSIPVGYIWARTIPCQNPSCGAEIPLMRQFWLAKKTGKNVALYPQANGDKVEFSIVGDGYKKKIPKDFDPTSGTVARAVATCLVCGSTSDANTTRNLFKTGKSGQRLIAVALHNPKKQGKRYRLAEDNDLKVFKKAENYLNKKREKLMAEWGIDPVPDEEVPTPCHEVDRLPMYGMKTWGAAFNSRQQLILITLAEKVRDIINIFMEKGTEKGYTEAISSYIGLIVDRIADKNSVLCRIISQTEAIGFSFSRQALGMMWDYIEMNPLEHPSGWLPTTLETISSIDHFCTVNNQKSNVVQESAIKLDFSDNYFDAIFTDPPYYDNVSYSYLSDFFYVWLKRSIGHIHPNLFSTPLTPKKAEIVAYPHGPEGYEGGVRFFEDMLSRSFQEIHRILKPDGISVIVYAHKSTAGWETLINSLLDSGLVMTGAWPINTEMQKKLNALGTASLMSSIYIVARKMKRESTAFYNDVKDELKRFLDKKLEHLWEQGVSGADFFIAAIGSAIEVFGKYEKVMDYEGNIIRADKLLEDVRIIATDYAVRQILHNGFGGVISDLTRFYVLWRWNFGEAKVIFDDANRLSKSCGIDLAREWDRGGFIVKEKEFIRVLGPTDRKLKELDESTELIDVLHKVLLLWQKGQNGVALDLLAQTGYGHNEAFYRVGQAVSESLASLGVDSKEQKLLDGFLSGRERVVTETKKRITQMELGES